MSKRAEMNRQRRWNRTVRGDLQARTRVEREVAEMSGRSIQILATQLTVYCSGV